MNPKMFYFVFLLLAAAYTGCKKDDEPKPMLTVTSVTPASGVIGKDKP